MKRGNFGRAAYHLGVNDPRRLSGRFLEFRYGWKPLVSDIAGSVRLLSAAINRPSVVDAEYTAVEVNHTVKDGPMDHVFIDSKLLIKTGLVASLDDTYRRVVNQSGIGDAATLGWELIPFSFVVDWLIPVGSMLEAMQASAGLRFVTGYRTGLVLSEFQGERNLPGWTTIRPATAVGKSFGFDRAVLTEFPRAVPYMKSPFSTSNALVTIDLINQLRPR